MDTKIIIYGAEWCPPCHETKHYLDHLGIKYEYRNVDENQSWGQEAVKKSGQFAIPIIDIDGDIIVGFNRPKIDEALKKAGLTK